MTYSDWRKENTNKGINSGKDCSVDNAFYSFDILAEGFRLMDPQYTEKNALYIGWSLADLINS